MARNTRSGWMVLVVVNVLFGCVLVFQQTGQGQPTSTGPARGVVDPFAAMLNQQAELLAEMRQVNTLLKEQNALLRSGKLTVQVEQKQSRAP